MHSRDRRVGRAGDPVAVAPGACLPPIRDPRISTRSFELRVPAALAYRVAAVLAFATALGVVVPLARLAPDRARSRAVTAAPASMLGLPPGATAAVDQYVQSGKLTASDGASGQYVGEAVAVSADGSTLVVDGPNSGPGTAYVFVKPPTGWADATESGAVTVPNHFQTDVALSVSVSASGDTIVFGEQGRAAYVFTRPAGGWSGHYSSTPDAKLTPSDSGAGFFGDAVGISGDTIVASARNGTVNGQFNRGALYVYAKPADGWHDATETARLTASDGAAGERLGLAVGIDGDTIAASAGHGNSGAVYVFVRPPSGWATGTQTAELTGPPDVSAYLGDTPNALAVSGGVVAAGARQYTSGTNTNQGAVFVYQRPASGWQDATETAMLTASDAAQYGYVGRAVAILGDTLVAGAENYGDGQQGAAYVYAAPAAGWQDATEDQKLVAADARDVDDFGIAVGIGSGTILAGAQFASAVTPGDDVGAAYVFSGPPAAPVAVTTAAGGVSASAATLNGTVDPGGRAVSDCHFDWGPTNAYGQQAPCGSPPGAATGASAVSAAIGGLGATSTYHYRVVATTDGGTSRGSDAQFTTQSPPTTQPAAAAGVTPPVAASPAAKLAVACSGRKLALLDVVRHGARVALLGAADASLIGQRVSIRYDDRKAVANVIIAADGFFRATAPLPPKAVRATNHARYVAVAGGQRSLFLKLTRRVVLQPPTAKAGKVTLTGTVLPPLTRPSAPIVVKQQVSCSKAAIVARTRPRRGGGFKVSVPAPRGAQAALYRVETAVRKTTRNPRSYPSFSLPQVVALQP